jgi:hypothetical protein
MIFSQNIETPVMLTGRLDALCDPAIVFIFMKVYYLKTSFKGIQKGFQENLKIIVNVMLLINICQSFIQK